MKRRYFKQPGLPVVSKQIGIRWLFVLFWIFVSPAFLQAEQIYDLEIVAQTGQAVGGSVPVALGQGPSINDAGKVAFIARDTAGQRGRVMLLNENVVERNYPVSAPATVEDFVQVNDIDQVVFRQGFDDGLVSYIQRLDTATGGQTIATGSFTPVVTAPFDYLLPWATLNDSGRGVFGADIGNSTVLGTRVGGSGTHNISPALTGFPNLYPMLADNDMTVVRWGGTTTSPLLRFISTNLDTANFIAESVDFNAIGDQPGISDDGNVAAFVGDHKTTGLGIYVSIFTGTSFTPIKIVGVGGTFSNFSLQPRVGVNRSVSNLGTDYTLAYVGFSASGKLGFYTTKIDITNPSLPVVATPSLVPWSWKWTSLSPA